MVDAVGKLFLTYAPELHHERVTDHGRIEGEAFLSDSGFLFPVVLGGDVAQLRAVEPGAGNADVNFRFGFRQVNHESTSSLFPSSGGSVFSPGSRSWFGRALLSRYARRQRAILREIQRAQGTGVPRALISIARDLGLAGVDSARCRGL